MTDDQNAKVLTAVQAASGKWRAAFNRGEEPWEASFQTGLPPGSYCDAASGPHTRDGACPGPSWDVDPDGSARITVQPHGAAGLFVTR